jgi:hypothetical protein
MATIMGPHQSQHLTSPRTNTQKICIGLGIFFVLAGLGGLVMPGLLGMHLSLLHNLMHLASGAFGLFFGYADDPKKAFNFSASFGVVYTTIGLAGFVFGEPGYPGVGYMEADNYLLRIIPNALEFGSADHTVHFVVGVVFLLSAYAWKNKSRGIGKTTFDVQTRAQSFSKNEVIRTTKSQEDVNLLNLDKKRKEDIERRI